MLRHAVRTGVLAATGALAIVAGLAPPASADPTAPLGASSDGALRTGSDAAQHGAEDGHLPATQKNVEVISKLKLTDVPGRISDVSVFGNTAYLGAYNEPDCTDGGVYIVDIADPANPRQIGFLPAVAGSYVSEGVQVTHVNTRFFTGDLLIHNNEICGEGGVGGISMYDVSDPTNPKLLVEGFGDFTDPDGNTEEVAHRVHSAFVWEYRNRAYAVMVDDDEPKDVDILDITNPRKPRVIAEYNFAELFPEILQEGLNEVFLHDAVVKEVRGRQILLASYWDAGQLGVDITDPRNPRLRGQTDFTFPDPELLESTGLREAPEGNAHQAEFTLDNRYVIGTDEDFSPNGIEGRNVTDGTTFEASQGSDTVQLQDGDTLSGTTVFVGRACDSDPAVPAPPTSGGPYIAVAERGACTFTEKVANIEGAGYPAAIIFNREGACALFGMSVEGGIPALSVSREVGYGFFGLDYDDEQCLRGSSEAPVALGTQGDEVTVRAFFDGWGYVHLYNAIPNGKVGKELDTYAIEQAHDPAFADGFGALTVHEVATSKQRADLAYLSYYAGGFRALRIVDGKLVETARYIDEGGNDFWGVEAFESGGRELVALSDRDFGLYILRYTGPGAP